MPLATSGQMMPAFVPSPPGGVELAQVPEPVAADHEAVVAVEAYSVNRGELYLLEMPREGWRPGQDVAGRVLAPARDGSGPAAGTRVVGHAWAGGWAPRVAVATEALVALPDAVATTVAATLPLAGLTAVRLLRAARVLTGRRVLVTGASGGVGHLLVELLAAQGARTTVVTRTPERAARLRTLGAGAVVHRVQDADGPFDVVLESVGGASLTAALERLADDGTLFWFGQASGSAATLDFFRVPGRAAVRRFAYWPHDEPDRVDLQALVELVAAGRLHPEVGLLADWHETPRALAALRDREVVGNVVLRIPA